MNSNSSARACFFLQWAQICHFVFKLKGWLFCLNFLNKDGKLSGTWSFPWDKLQRIKFSFFFFYQIIPPPPTPTNNNNKAKVLLGRMFPPKLVGYRTPEDPFLHCEGGQEWDMLKTTSHILGIFLYILKAWILTTFQTSNFPKHHCNHFIQKATLQNVKSK